MASCIWCTFFGRKLYNTAELRNRFGEDISFAKLDYLYQDNGERKMFWISWCLALRFIPGIPFWSFFSQIYTFLFCKGVFVWVDWFVSCALINWVVPYIVRGFCFLH